MGKLFQDLRYTFRQFRRAPAFTITAVLTLALGIGANTAIFSLVNAFLLKPAPVANPRQITTLAFHRAGADWSDGGNFSWAGYKELRAQAQTSFSDVIANTIGLDGFATDGQQPERVMNGYVSGNFFDALGARPAAGRLFLRSEGEVLNHDPVLVLSYNFWKQKFNLDPGVVGRNVTIDGHPFTVIGVVQKGFTGLTDVGNIAAYLPVSELSVEGTPADLLNSWQNRNLGVHARLRPGASLQQARAEMQLAAQAIARLHPEEKPFDIGVFPGPRRRILPLYLVSALFLGLAAMVLLLACVNVANLVLVRATARHREMAIRAALGARRVRLLRQMITESVTLALLGGVAGVLIGLSAGSLLGSGDLRTGLPISLKLGFDWRIFSYSFLMALLAGVVVGVAPALRIAHGNVNLVLHESSRAIAGGRQWVRQALVSLQVAGSLVLLVVAGLFLRSLQAFQTSDLGFRPEHVLNVSIDTSEIGMTDAQTRALADAIDLRLHQLAGVQFVSHASATPMGVISEIAADTISIDGVEPAPNAPALEANYNVVSGEYFDVMSIAILRGRSLAMADDEHHPNVAVISAGMAEKFWPHQDAVGRTFRMGQDKIRLEVVGIARNAEFSALDGAVPKPTFYVPYAQHFKGASFMVFQLKTRGDPLSVASAVTSTIHKLAPQLPVFQVESQRQGLYTLNGLLVFQAGAVLAALMGGLGLALAMIGTYGVISYAVSLRVHEIGLRMALGATRASVFRMIYRQSMSTVAVGLAAGLVVALLVARGVASFVLINPWDPVTFATVIFCLTVAALASCYLPARRATTVEPMTALRES